MVLKNKIIRVVCITLFSLLIICSSLNLSKVNVFAEENSYSGAFVGYSEDLTENELYNETNTYDYTGLNTTTNAYYNVSGTGLNTNQVSTNQPLITVLTHGLNSSASTWSNVNNYFGY